MNMAELPAAPVAPHLAGLSRAGGSDAGPLQPQLPQLLHVGAAGAEDVADIGAAGQIAHTEPEQPALELEIPAHAADPHRLAVRPRRLCDGLESGFHAVVRVLAGDAHLGRKIAGA